MRGRCYVLTLLFLLSLASPPALAGISAGGHGPSGVSVGATAKVDLAPENDPDGSGTATLSFDVRHEKLCFDIDLKKVDPVVAVHIHAGAAGLSNEDLIVVDLDFAEQGLVGCTHVGREVLKSILDNLDSNDPPQFYLHVHSSGFSTGAVRGQIERD